MKCIICDFGIKPNALDQLMTMQDKGNLAHKALIPWIS